MLLFLDASLASHVNDSSDYENEEAEEHGENGAQDVESG